MLHNRFMLESHLQIKTVLKERFQWDLAKLHLEQQGWVVLDDFLSAVNTASLLETFKLKLENDDFEMAKIGKDLNRSLEKQVRMSQTAWIEDWTRSSTLCELNDFFSALSIEMNRHFYLTIKRWESQMAFYPEGGFYKKHLDQLRGGENRIMTCIFYLNDCSTGGELVVYDRDNKNKKAAVIVPKVGRCVLFFSSQIYHEVLPCFDHRYSLATWLRHDKDQLLS